MANGAKLKACRLAVPPAAHAQQRGEQRRFNGAWAAPSRTLRGRQILAAKRTAHIASPSRIVPTKAANIGLGGGVASGRRRGTDALKGGRIGPSLPRRLPPISPSAKHGWATLIGFAAGGTTVSRNREEPHIALQAWIIALMRRDKPISERSLRNNACPRLRRKIVQNTGGPNVRSEA